MTYRIISPTIVMDSIKIGGVNGPIGLCRSMFRITQDPERRTYSSGLSDKMQQGLARSLITSMGLNIRDPHQSHVADVEFQNYFRFFNAVRDEDPPSLPVLRAEIIGSYDGCLSSFGYMQLAGSKTVDETHPLLATIRQKKLEPYFIDLGEIYGPLKTPYHEPLTLGEFALYRLRMGHGTIFDIASRNSLEVLHKALVLHQKILPLSKGDDAIIHLIHNLATFRLISTVEDFIAEAKKLEPLD